MDDSQNRAFLSTIESPYQAELMIRDASNALYVVAAGWLVSALLQTDYVLLICGLLNLACGYLVGRHKSKVAALFALFLAISTMALAIHNHVLTSGMFMFGLLAIWAGARSSEAMTKLRRGFPQPPEDKI
jgi:hypothetical protein